MKVSFNNLFNNMCGAVVYVTIYKTATYAIGFLL